MAGCYNLKKMNIEIKRLEADLLRARSVIAEMEVRILEREEDIGRILVNIKQQEGIIKDLENKLGENHG